MPIKPPKLLVKKYAEWLMMFNKVANLNKWDDEEKLAHGLMSLTGSTQSWAIRASHASWNVFQQEFKDRYMKKENIFNYTSKLMAFKQRPDESNRKFLHRLEKLWTTYAALAAANGEPVSSFELILVKSLVKGIKSKSLRRSVRMQDYTTITAFIKGFRDLDDLDASDDSDSDDGYASSSSSTYSNDSIASFKQTTVKKDQEKKEMSDLLDSVKKLTVALLARQSDSKPQDFKTQNNPRSLKCYNCQEKGHGSNDCIQPCKFCGGNHRHYSCEQYKRGNIVVSMETIRGIYMETPTCPWLLLSIFISEDFMTRMKFLSLSLLSNKT